MSRQLTLTSKDKIEYYIKLLRHSAEEAQFKLDEVSSHSDPIHLLENIKFEKIGYDPLDSTRSLNLIEQVNQTFTYLSSFMAAYFLFENHQGLNHLILNLGTQPGSDFESQFNGGIAAEVFSSVTPSNNNKLRKDIIKVGSTKAKNKYVFFFCPGIGQGPYNNPLENEVLVYSLGDYIS